MLFLTPIREALGNLFPLFFGLGPLLNIVLA